MHVRATLGNQQIQVASSDRHTVKPWLSARLDYSPPVRDFAQDGYALIGGRIDYLDRHPVATLVYHVRNHTIDVYVRPETAHPAASALRTIRGFNIAQRFRVRHGLARGVGRQSRGADGIRAQARAGIGRALTCAAIDLPKGGVPRARPRTRARR